MFCGDVTSTAYVCLECWKRILWISPEHCCIICGQPFRYKIYDICEECLLSPPSYDKAVEVFLYNEFSKAPILNFKHKDATYLAEIFAQLIFRNIKNYIEKYDVIYPVPIHRRKLIKRMYNQSGLLAKELSKLAHIPYDPLNLEKIKITLPQEGLSRDTRLRNVVGSFGISKNVNGKSIILVDDVITTGATANECAKILKSHGAKKVFVAAIAKVTKSSFV